MDAEERKKTRVYDALVVLLALALLVFISRLWPILLLIILGIFAAALCLAFMPTKSAAPTNRSFSQPARRKAVSEQELLDMAYGAAVRRISELVRADFPDARWIWESPQAKKRIADGESVYILLDRAGDFRRAKVAIRDLRAVALDYEAPKDEEKLRDVEAVLRNAYEEASDEPDTEPAQEDYSLLAFEWVEANIIDLNRRCNDAIGHGEADTMLTADELPRRESWEEICCQLKREGLNDVEITPSGIRVYLIK